MNNGQRYEPLTVPRRVILGPGPSSANPRVLRAMSLPIIGYLDPAFFDLLDELSGMLAELFKTRQRAFAVAGAGSAGMEAGLVSLAAPGDTVIICSYGYFCERQIIMAERLGFNVIALRTEWGKSMDPQVLADALKANPETQLVVGIHAETSAGTIQPIAEFARLAHESGALFMTDVVTSLAGCELEFDEWDLDFAYSGSQKCLAAPPGISPVALSERGLDYIRSRPKPPSSWYLDLALIADYWGSDHVAHHTAPVSMIYGLREAVGMALNETLEVRWKRHEANADALRAGLAALNLEMPVSPEERLDQLTVIKLPKGVDDIKLRTQLLEEYSIEVGRGLGQFAGEVIRIGLMGESCVPANVFALLNALEKILPEHGFEVAKGAATAAASAQLAENPSPLYTA
ncbi:MAG: alanine--glyoxylate aminotransferase family protein [Dehalococcoidia bacterium]|nr:alanine--glyoxylate aminotransferase family protein [Dehalococcoidia bacterium]MDP7090478.1 alanine--glyoxylate aminotransferase family protein [Dehalococcoidia bacterium]MDP7261182.1 alanine--glyoxylate aminotransferase family protein [Dehalococcoidia bacterium]MDP7485879.1 alanine--glyoxylate aminotransferase family protein [Dehalococcoidia bacterium]